MLSIIELPEAVQEKLLENPVIQLLRTEDSVISVGWAAIPSTFEAFNALSDEDEVEIITSALDEGAEIEVTAEGVGDVDCLYWEVEITVTVPDRQSVDL